MGAMPARWLSVVAGVLIALCSSSCGRGKQFYPVSGQVFVNSKPAEGLMIVFHPLDEAESVQPTAVVGADGSFALKSYLVRERVVKDGAPAGKYLVTCTWYPPNLQDYLGMENLPDKLHGRYALPKTSGLEAEVLEQPTELPPFQLKMEKK